MPSHVNSDQTIRQDHGEFITIANSRIRKSIIMAYNWCPIEKDIEGHEFGIKLVTQFFTWGVAIGTIEEAHKEVLRLDWIFKGDAR